MGWCGKAIRRIVAIVEQSPAYLLHERPFRETSSLLEVFTPDHGRVGLVYRGVRRSNARKQRPRPFSALRLSWSGRGELYTLTSMETERIWGVTKPTSVLCGMYVNELLINLVPRLSASASLYEDYERVVQDLVKEDFVEPSLRRFEYRLLSAIGYGLQLDHDAQTGEPLQAHRYYVYDNNLGPVHCSTAKHAGAVSGKALLALREKNMTDRGVQAEIKRLLRGVLDHHLNGKTIHTRSVFRHLSQ